MAQLSPPFDALIVQLASLDRAVQGVNSLFMDLGASLLRGGAARLHVDRYNAAAIAIYREQEQVLELLRALQIPGVAPKPPFPPLLTTQAGSIDLSKLPDVVTSENLLVYYQHPKTPELATATGELGILPLLVWAGVGLTVGFIGGYIATSTLKNAISEVEKQRTARYVASLQAKQYERQIEQIRWRTLKLYEAADKCAGGDKFRWPACLASALTAVETTPTPANLAKAIQDLLSAQKERSWLWWIGGVVVVGGLAVGGLLLYQNRHKLRLRAANAG